MTKSMEITAEEVLRAATSMGIDFDKVNKEELVMGAVHEATEHPKVINDTAKAVQVAIDHLAEIPDYYTRLKTMEGEIVQKGGPGSGRKPEGGASTPPTTEEIKAYREKMKAANRAFAANAKRSRALDAQEGGKRMVDYTG